MTTPNVNITSLATGGISDFAIAVSIASQLPGRFDGGPANVLRHLVLSAELTRAFGAGNAQLLLNQHEWFESGPDNHVDVVANRVGVAIGEFVDQNGGGPQAVLDLAFQAMEQSFVSWNWFNASGNGQWTLVSPDVFAPPVIDVVLNYQGIQFSVPPLARRAE